jgi:hypothetical protein
MQAPENRGTEAENTIKGAKSLGISVPHMQPANVKGKACPSAIAFFHVLPK